MKRAEVLTEKRECVITCMMASGLRFIATDMRKRALLEHRVTETSINQKYIDGD